MYVVRRRCSWRLQLLCREQLCEGAAGLTRQPLVQVWLRFPDAESWDYGTFTLDFYV